MRYVATFVPVMKPGTVLVGSKQDELDALELVQAIKQDDELWLMMGSTNAAVALGAHLKGASVYQLSYPRAQSLNGGGEGFP